MLQHLTNPRNCVKPLLVAFVLTMPCLVALGQGLGKFGAAWPERLSTKRDINSAKPDVTHIDIWNLPIEDYPLLTKFTRLNAIDLESREGTFATDNKLRSLAALGFTNLSCIVLLNCRLITDEGIRHLSRIQSLKSLSLEGTAISDAACEFMASQMRLTGVNIANCKGVTLKGLKALTTSTTLEEVELSADKLTQEEVLDLVASFKKVTRCDIVDPKRKLDASVIKKKGAERGMQVFVRQTGALQDAYDIGKEDTGIP